MPDVLTIWPNFGKKQLWNFQTTDKKRGSYGFQKNHEC